MKICIVSSWLPSKRRPNFAPFVYNFAESLARFGPEVSVVTPLEEGEESVKCEDLMTIYRVNPRSAIFSILRLVLKAKPDIIHVQAPNSFSCTAIPVAKLTRIPIIGTVHRAEVAPVSNPISIIRKHVLARFNRIVAVSNHTKSLAVSAGVEESKISVIYNSCDERVFFHGKDKVIERNKHNFTTNDNLILFVGNLIKRKGLSSLIESLNILQSKLSDFTAIIVGQGEDFEELKLLVDKYGLNSHVKFYGRVPKATLSGLYTAADVFVLPSTSEGHSVALLEAMASGLPIVASDIEGNRESVEDGVNGFLFRTGSSENFAEKLAMVLSDPKLKKMMSDKSYERYTQKFSTKTQIDNYLKIYDSLIKKAENQ